MTLIAAGIAIALASRHPTYAATPQKAALGAVYSARPFVVRTNVAGRYATVLIRGAGGYALGEWYGAGGGYALFRFRAGSWQRITGGGGALGVSDMRRYHIAQSAWCTFRIFNAPCKV